MGRQLIRGFQDKKFQTEIALLVQRFPDQGASAKCMALKEAAMKAHGLGEVLSKHGFSCSVRGLFDMTVALETYQSDPFIAHNRDQLQELLYNVGMEST